MSFKRGASDPRYLILLRSEGGRERSVFDKIFYGAVDLPALGVLQKSDALLSGDSRIMTHGLSGKGNPAIRFVTIPLLSRYSFFADTPYFDDIFLLMIRWFDDTLTFATIRKAKRDNAWL